VKYLIDTHVFIWFIEGSEQLPPNIRAKVLDINNDCYISIASLWEIAIKSSLGKLKLNIPFTQIADFLLQTEIKVLPVEMTHLLVLTGLELIHRDPFDRIIIAQSISEELPLLSIDKQFSKYPIHLIWD
jgi:PIN domain nuclease of toxin-antitoxin system